MRLNHSFLIVGIYLFATAVAFAAPTYPTAPDLQMTPGDVCLHPNALRYPEKIPYCDRDVNIETLIKMKSF